MAKPSKFLLTPTPYEEAAQFIADKPVVSREIFDRLLPEVQARAFTITGIESADVLQTVRDRIAELPRGGDWNKIKAGILEDIGPWFDAQGANRRAELLMRMHGFQAYRVGQWETIQQTKEALPYLRYIATNDARTRPDHAALHGIVLPVDDPFWERHMPPWDWGCRCQVVQISEYEADQIRKADKKRPPDRRLVLDETARSQLRSGRFVRGPGEVFDVRAPEERGRSGPGTPGDLRMPLSMIRDRYDPEVFGEFENWARGTNLPGLKGEASVWQWLGGEELPRAHRPLGPKLKPKNLAPGVIKEINETMAAIDQVHDDGPLPRLPVLPEDHPDYDGSYNRLLNELKLNINNVDDPHFTLVHEIGHWLDHRAWGSGLQMGSEISEDLAPLREIWKRDRTLKAFDQQLRDFMIPDKKIAYYMSEAEIFARSYSQWIAVRSKSPILLEQLNFNREYPFRYRNLIQWPDEDFGEIAEALDDLFSKRGWLNER
ncbi:phage minor head protein [Cerasicoccus maritimus]|uniref:phage minor head protein n=1 Tax=Cerasicoccus maritimus TaxID=490089 RepID=UPI002852B33A|nr:phage minor head protein [Cerasicoccus maritimus]